LLTRGGLKPEGEWCAEPVIAFFIPTDNPGAGYVPRTYAIVPPSGCRRIKARAGVHARGWLPMLLLCTSAEFLKRGVLSQRGDEDAGVILLMRAAALRATHSGACMVF
jgi:hypothetical protein